MIIYINGDGHCSGAYAQVPFAVAEDDFQLWYQGRAPHPANLPVVWGSYLANHFKAEVKIDADIRNTESDVIAQTLQYAENNYRRGNLKIIIGYPEVNTTRFIYLSDVLKKLNVRHIFYPTQDYVQYLTEQGCQPRHESYFGADAHKIWFNRLSKELTKML
jgi:hypothetical protein